MNMITLHQLETYFQNDIGPVFCTPSTDLIYRHKKFTGMLGIIRPKYCKSNLISVDWTLNKDWKSLVALTPTMGTMKFTLDELNIIKPGEDIPQMADTEYPTWNWRPDARGQCVAISDCRWRLLAEKHPAVANSYTELRKLTGVVVEKQNKNDLTLMVSFVKGEKGSHIVNVPREILLKLPASFRPVDKPKVVVTQPDYTPKPKHEVGDVVRVSTSTDNGDQYLGLVGIVSAIDRQEREGLGYCGANAYSDYVYTLNMDTLPNRCLSLCEGEGKKDMLQPIKVKQYGMEAWDARICDKAYLINYNRSNKREYVWIKDGQVRGEVASRGTPKQTLDSGVEISVMADDTTTTETITCRDVDYLWEPDALRAVLEDGFVTVGVEEEKYNPNDPTTHKVYIYVFNLAKDFGQHVSYKVLLGTLVSTPSKKKKFFKSLANFKITHPWAIKRYLKNNSLGYFYQIFDIAEYINNIGYFSRGGQS